MMSDYVLKAETGHINLSDVAFRLNAREHLVCFQSYKPTKKSTLLQYFLVCRAIELALKALHLESNDVKFVKLELSHNLSKSYHRLHSSHPILTNNEVKILAMASDLYRPKAFEYFLVADAVEAYSRFPDLDALYAIAERIVNYVEDFHSKRP